jgi:hypothetical protein
MDVLNDTKVMKHILKRASRTPFVSDGGDTRIRGEIKGLLEQKNHETRFFNHIRYNPVFMLILIIPLLLLAISGSIVPFLYNPLPVLTFISGSATLEETTQNLLPGNRLGEGDTLIVSGNSICDMVLKQSTNFRLFPDSIMTVASLRKTSSQSIVLELQKGSLYLDKEKGINNARMVVEISDYRFLMQGTRVFFDIQKGRITASCYEGKVTIIRTDGSEYSLLAREKIEITIESEGTRYDITGWITDKESTFDRTFKEFLPFDKEAASLYHSIRYGEEKEESIVTKEIDFEYDREKDGLKDIILPDKKEAYTITETAVLSDPAIIDNRVNLIFTHQDADTGYILTPGKFFTLKNGSIEEAVVFESSPIFKIRPVDTGNILCLASVNTIYFIEKNTFTIKSRVALKKSEQIGENYYPVYYDNTIYFPVKNTGYYTMNMDEQYQLELFSHETFPIAPLVSSEGIYTGANYRNYIALLDEKGKQLWKCSLNGESYTNFIKIDENIFTFLAERDNNYIIRINNTGIIDKKWPVSNEVLADFISYKKKIFGFYSTGMLFSLDTETGEKTIHEAVVTGNLSLEKWRAFRPYTNRTLLFTGTDKGELLIFDMEKGITEKRILIKEGEAFYAAPVVENGTIYLVSNTGKVFAVTLNGK